jgi:hypothetical protein
MIAVLEGHDAPEELGFGCAGGRTSQGLTSVKASRWRVPGVDPEVNLASNAPSGNPGWAEATCCRGQLDGQPSAASPSPAEDTSKVVGWDVAMRDAGDSELRRRMRAAPKRLPDPGPVNWVGTRGKASLEEKQRGAEG